MASRSETEKVFNLTVDVNDLEGAFADMNDALKTAVVNSLNTVGRTVNKEIAKDIKDKYNIKARTLRLGRLVSLRRADKRKAIPFFTISILKKGRGLALFSAKRGQAGVSIIVKKSRKTVRGSFFIRSKQGKMFVARKDKKRFFILRKSKTGRSYVARGSEFLHGPSIASLYRRRAAFRLIDKVINRDYQKKLNENFNKQFEKKR